MSNEKTTTTPPKTEFPKPPPFMAFDPMQVWTIGQQAWQQTQQAWLAMVSEAFGRSQAFTDEMAAFEAQMSQRAHDAVDQWSKLAHETINYGAQLSAQARKLGFETARKMTPGV